MATSPDPYADPRPLRVVIADDHALFRTGLRRLLELQGVEVVAEAGDGTAALEATARLRPDVLLLDLHMPGTPGPEVVGAACVPVVVLSGSSHDEDVLEALVAGAIGFLVKGAGVDEVVAGLRHAVRGDSAFSPRVAALLAEQVRASGARHASAPDVALSPREVDVLRLVAGGADNAAIAETLSVSVHTVKDHVSSILEKLGVENRVQAAVWAARRGLLDSRS